MRPTEKTLTSVLSRNGYKITSPRLAVLKAIASTSAHLTPADVYARVQRDNPQIGLVTVYRTLEILSELGLICRVHRGGRSRSYTQAPTGHHHHIICSACGAVEDFSNCDLSDMEIRLSKETGFVIEGHLLEFSGRCKACQQRELMRAHG